MCKIFIAILLFFIIVSPLNASDINNEALNTSVYESEKIPIIVIHKKIVNNNDKTSKHKKLSIEEKTQQYKTIYLSKTKYDEYFKKYVYKHVPAADYRLLKTICTIESKLNPYAVSTEGALGICQLMPKTYISIIKRNKDIPVNGYYTPAHAINVLWSIILF